jgi:hypothetical protein
VLRVARKELAYTEAERVQSITCAIPGCDSRLLKTKYREMNIKFSGIVP